MYINVAYPDGANLEIFANTGGKDFDKTKPTIILVHGAGMDHSIWWEQNRYLAHHGFNILSIDLPGHGRSQGHALASIEELGDFLGCLITAAKINRAVLVGHSMGAIAALQACQKHGQKIAGLVLCGMGASMPVHPDLLEAARQNDIKAAELISFWGHAIGAQKKTNIAHGIWMTKASIRLIERSGPGVLYTDLDACNRYTNALSLAQSVTCKTLLLTGQQDKMAPPKSTQAVLDALPEGERNMLHAIGHMMMIEAPDATREAILSFSRQVFKE
jgi:pimeloyl-ACP methyl ester carboxylesterase